eukprot:Phypoly_transcript_02577.p1 GENE.Phypoly_transcript_02577~~Phypoly_transcript_02577.p1  ORF type:complete len:694 (+),score=89.69 Phypoly_transcript_02577:619-2700(+)
MSISGSTMSAVWDEFVQCVGSSAEDILLWELDTLKQVLDEKQWTGVKRGTVEVYYKKHKALVPSSGPAPGTITDFLVGHKLQLSVWEYQESPVVNAEIAKGVELCFNGWVNGSHDKFWHPFFFVSSGPGVGKSRLLDEFYGICKEQTISNAYIYPRFLNNCFVFSLTFENGTPFNNLKVNGAQQIGVRMHYQLVGRSCSLEECYKQKKSPKTVLEELARAKSLSLRDCTFIILIDSIQKVYYGGTKEMFDLLMATITELASGTDAFVLVACSGTFYEPVALFLSKSSHPCIKICPPPLDGHQIIKDKDPIVYVMVDDAGGHARTLLVLQLHLEKHGPPEENNSNTFFSGVLVALEELYPELVKRAKEIVPALKYVLTQLPVTRQTEIGPNLTVDQLVELGLFTYTDKCTLMCPFMLFCLLKERSKDPVLKNLSLPSYVSLEGNPDSCPVGVGWEDWERFVVQFIVLKAQLVAGSPIPFSHLHYGATLGSHGEVEVIVPYLENFEKIHNQIAPNKMHAYYSNHPTKLIVNATATEGADSFFGLLANESPSVPKGTIPKNPVLEVHQNKKTTATLNQDLWNTEFTKCTSGHNDFFIMFGTLHTSIKKENLPPRGALVSRENFVAYFGPFAGRAFCTKKPINKVSKEELREARGIGQTTAEKILQERARGPFLDCEDFKTRTNLKKTYSNMFSYEM